MCTPEKPRLADAITLTDTAVPLSPDPVIRYEAAVSTSPAAAVMPAPRFKPSGNR